MTPTPARPQPAPPRFGEVVPGSLSAHEIGDESFIHAVEITNAAAQQARSTRAEIHACRVQGGSLAESWWRRGRWSDTEFIAADLANLSMLDAGIERVVFDQSRATGIHVAGCGLTDVRWRDCVLNLANFRAAKLRRVSFERCILAGSEWGEAQLVDVTFTDCDLSAAQFSDTDHHRVVFDSCRLDGLGGITSLRGATIHSADSFVIAQLFAHEVGVRLNP